MRNLAKLIGRGAKRAFTSDGGSLSKITTTLGEKDEAYYWAMLIRLLTPIVITFLVFLIAMVFGVEVSEVLDILDEVS